MTQKLTAHFILPPPDKQEIELEVASLFENGDIANIARYVQRDSGLVSKLLSPNCGDKNNVIYFGLLFLWAFDCIRRSLGDQVIAIILRERAKWLNDIPNVIEDEAELTADVGVQFSEFVECRMKNRSLDEQIKEADDIEKAAHKLVTELISKRNIERFGIPQILPVGVQENARSRRNGKN